MQLQFDKCIISRLHAASLASLLVLLLEPIPVFFPRMAKL